MPRVRYYDVDVLVLARVSTPISSDADLTHGAAVEQVLAKLRPIRGLAIGAVKITETDIGGSPLTPSVDRQTLRPVPGSGDSEEAKP